MICYIVFSKCYIVFSASRVLKRLQEGDDGKIEDGFGNIVADVGAGNLESLNMNWHLQNFYIQIAETCTIQLSVDGDCAIQDLVKTVQTFGNNIELYHDKAHLAKNVPANITAVVKDHKFHGSTYGRIGRKNLLKLITGKSYLNTLFDLNTLFIYNIVFRSKNCHSKMY